MSMWAGLAAIGVFVAFPSRFAAAQASLDDEATARRLFLEGKQLLDDGRLAEACPKLARSDALDPEPGTEVNLARCYEGLGKTASAYWTWQAAAAAAAHKEASEPDEAGRKKQADREAYARSRIDVLAGRLLRVTLHVSPATDGGVDIRLDGTALPKEQWGSSIPVDPGPHHVTASAPSKQPWVTEFEVDEEKLPSVTVVVPSLQATDKNEWQRTTAVALGAGGIASLAVGAAFGVAAIGAHNGALTNCTSSLNCNARGIDQLSQAKSDAAVADVTFAVGGTALVAALLLLAIPSHGSSALRWTPEVSVGRSSVSIGGAF